MGGTVGAIIDMVLYPGQYSVSPGENECRLSYMVSGVSVTKLYPVSSLIDCSDPGELSKIKFTEETVVKLKSDRVIWTVLHSAKLGEESE